MKKALIHSDPAVMMGKPVIVGTRITVEAILEKLAAGETTEQILAAHPRLTREHISAALKFAAKALRADVVYPVSNNAACFRNAFIFLLLIASCGTQEAVAAPDEGIGFVAKLINRPIQGQCSVTLQPDRAVISIIITGDGDKPAKAKQQLADSDRKAREIAASHNGRVQSFEMVRYMRGGAVAMPALPADRSLPGSPAATTPFLFMQRLDLEFPLNADVDGVLDKLVDAGINRFGKLVNPYQAYSGQPTAAVRYVISEPQKKLDRIQAQCRDTALKQWCDANTTTDNRHACVAELGRYAERITTQNMYLRSQSVPREQGGQSPVMVNYPWQPYQFEMLEFLGKDPLQLDGSISLRFAQ